MVGMDVKMIPIYTEDYPVKARRPKFKIKQYKTEK